MRKLKYQDCDFRYPFDVERIVRVLTGAGYPVVPHEAQRMWDAFSDSLSAGWMMLDAYTDNDIFMILTEPNETSEEQPNDQRNRE